MKPSRSGTFLPISRQEIRKRARGKRMSVNEAVIGLLEEHLTQNKMGPG